MMTMMMMMMMMMMISIRHSQVALVVVTPFAWWTLINAVSAVPPLFLGIALRALCSS